MCFHVQIKLLRVTVSSAQVRSVPATTCAKYTIYRARPQFVKLSEMLRDDGWMDGWMAGCDVPEEETLDMNGGGGTKSTDAVILVEEGINASACGVASEEEGINLAKSREERLEFIRPAWKKVPERTPNKNNPTPTNTSSGVPSFCIFSPLCNSYN